VDGDLNGVRTGGPGFGGWLLRPRRQEQQRHQRAGQGHASATSTVTSMAWMKAGSPR
jgi:hypothetical protein